MAEQKLNQVNTTTALRFPFTGGQPGAADTVAFVGIFDIGQGNMNALFNALGQPFIYYDMGGGMGGGLFTYPEPGPTFCYRAARLVVQSHFDEDHYKSGMLGTFLAGVGGMFPRPRFVVPRQAMGKFGGAAKATLLGANVDIYHWPLPATGAGVLARVTLVNTGVEIIKCRGSDKNNSGLALRIEDQGAANNWVLLSGDAHYSQTRFPWNTGGQNPDQQSIGLVPSHHGARETSGHVPRPLGGAVRAVAYSFGAGNVFGHPFHDAAHANDGVLAYRNRGWADAGRIQTAGRPLDKPHFGPRGNLAIRLSGANAAAARPARDPNSAPGHGSVASAAVALVAVAASASRVTAAAAGSHVAVAAAYQATLEHHRGRSDRPVAEYLLERGVPNAPIVAVATGLGALVAHLATALNANHSAAAAESAAESAAAVGPLARAAAQLAAAASTAGAIAARVVATGAHPGPGGAKRKINRARLALIGQRHPANTATRAAGTAAAQGLNGRAPGMRFLDAGAIAIDGAGLAVVADTGNSRVGALNFGTGALLGIAGAARTEGLANGNGYVARFRKPAGLALNVNVALRHGLLLGFCGLCRFRPGGAAEVDRRG